LTNKDISWRFLISLVLGFVTFTALRFAANSLPYGPGREYASDAASFPASLVASAIYPYGGASTVSGGPSPAVFIAISEIVFYALIWQAVLAWRRRKSRHAIL
jgi:hypothetical protein